MMMARWVMRGRRLRLHHCVDPRLCQ